MISLRRYFEFGGRIDRKLTGKPIGIDYSRGDWSTLYIIRTQREMRDRYWIERIRSLLFLGNNLEYRP